MEIECSVKSSSNENQRYQLNTILGDIKKKIAAQGGDVNYVTLQQLQQVVNNPPSARGGSGGAGGSVGGGVTGSSGGARPWFLRRTKGR